MVELTETQSFYHVKSYFYYFYNNITHTGEKNVIWEK